MVRRRSLVSTIKRALWLTTAPEKWAYRRGILRADRLPLPDFLGIGAPRSATTWLYRNLRKHPQVFVVPPKELHYFNGHFGRPLRSYAANFRGVDPELKRGEMTPDYLYLPPSRIRFIRDIMPEVRLILLLRHPVDRAWSDALRVKVLETGREPGQVDASEFFELIRNPRFLARGNYVACLSNWRAAFPEEQLLVGFYEEVVQEPRRLLEAVLGHIGVSAELDWDDSPYQERFHRSPEVPMPLEARSLLEETYREEVERMSDLFGDRVGSW